MKTSVWRKLARGVILAVVLLALGALTTDAANWDGDGGSSPPGTTYFDWSGRVNFYGNSEPAWNSTTPLYFNYNNGGHSIMVQNIGYRAVQSIIYESTFTGNTTLQGSDGFDLYWKIENNDTGHHTVNVPIIVQGTALELNPVSGNLTIGGGINNFANRSYLVYGSGGHTLTVNSDLAGSGSDFTIHQNSVVVFNGAMTYTGDTVLNAGTLRLGANNRISDSSDVDLNAGATFDLNNYNETVASLDNDGTLSLGTGQLIVNGGSSGWSGTMSASSGGSLVKKGSGTISITGNNVGMAAGSALYVVGGTVGLNNNNAAGSAAIYLGETSGSDAATLDISTAGINIGNAITVRSGSGGAKIIDNASSGSITFSGAITLNDSVRVTASSGETTIFSGGLSGAGGFIKQGAGTMQIGGANGYSGYTYLDEGTLSIASGGDLTGSSGIDLGSAVFNPGGGAGTANAALDLQSGAADLDRAVTVKAGSGTRTLSSAGNNSVSGSVLLQNNLTVSSSSGTLSFQSTVNLSNSGNNDLNVNGAGNVAINGSITAATGASDINKSGAGTLTIAGDNTGAFYKLNLAGGTVYLTHANALGTAYGDKINFATANSELRVGANIAPATLGVTINNVTATFNVDGGSTFTVAGAIADGGGTPNIIKSGAGTMIINGAATYDGTTTLNAGRLTVGAAGDISSSSGVTVQGGILDIQGTSAGIQQNAGTVMGTGTIEGNYIQSGGVLSPGNSPEQIDVDGNVTWNGGSYLWEINDVAGTAGGDPGWDLINIDGALTVNAGYTINVTSLTLGNLAGNVFNFDMNADYVGIWEIARTTGGITLNTMPGLNVSGFSNPYNGNWYLSVVGDSMYVNYDHNIPPVSIPEPNTLVYFGMAFAGLFAVRSRIRKAISA